MLKKVGRFEVESDGNIHLKNVQDERDLFDELDRMSKKDLRNIPLVTYDYNSKNSVKLQKSN